MGGRATPQPRQAAGQPGQPGAAASVITEASPRRAPSCAGAPSAIPDNLYVIQEILLAHVRDDDPLSCITDLLVAPGEARTDALRNGALSRPPSRTPRSSRSPSHRAEERTDRAWIRLFPEAASALPWPRRSRRGSPR